MNNRLYFILGIVFFGGILAESFVIEPKKKKEPKRKPEDCCHQILESHKTSARIDQYSGQIKGIELNWAEDFFDDEKNALLKLVTQEELQECYTLFQKHNAALERFEQELREMRDELKLIEQKVSVRKNKK
jgi:hypothetical protein